MGEFVLREESLGILESELSFIGNKNMCRLSLHYFFSFCEDRLYCRSLDFDMYYSVDLKSEIKNIDLSDGNAVPKLANDLVNKLANELTFNIIDHVYMRKNSSDENFMWHSREQYWAEYRKLKIELDNNNLNKFFYNKSKEFFIDLNEGIEKKIEDVAELINTKQYFKEDILTERIREIAEAA